MRRKLTLAGLTLTGLLALAPSAGAYTRGYYGYARPFYPWPATVTVIPTYITGEVKIDTKSKDALVYVDGGYLGVVRKAKSFDLRPGNYEIELRNAGGKVLMSEKIAIVPGKTTHIDAMGITG
jgi:hypothetical protein